MDESLMQQGAGRSEHAMFWLFCALFFLLPATTSPAVVVGGVILLIWLISGKAYTGRKGYMGTDWALPVLLMLLIPFVGLTYTSYPELGLKMAEKSYYWLFAFALATLGIGESGRRTLIYSFLGGVSFSVVASFLQHLGFVPLHRGVSASGFMNHINYGLFLVLAIMLLTFLFREEKQKGRRWAVAVVMVIFTVNLAMSLARIGHLAFVLLSPLMLINLFGKRNLLIIMVASSVLGASLFLSPVVRNRVNLAVSEVKGFSKLGDVGTSIGLRLVMWEGALRIYAKNPVVGVGTGGYAGEMQKYRRDKGSDNIRHPHNSFLYMAASYGTVGLGLLLWYLWVLFMKGWRRRESAEGFAVLAFCLVLLVGSLTDTQINNTYSTGVMAALMTGLRLD